MLKLTNPAFRSRALKLAAIAVISSAFVSQMAFAANLNIDATQRVRSVDERVFGVAATIWDPDFSTQETADLLTAAGIRCLRFPGGSLSDEYHWESNTTLSNTWTWATDFDAFATVATAINARVFNTVNYGTGTPEEAAAWVDYSNVVQGYGFKYWEIGNENYGVWETDQQAVPHDPYTYAVRARDYIEQMKAADPTIKVGVVVINGEDSYANNTSHPATNPRTGIVHNGWTPVLLTTLRNLGVTPDFVIFHRYEQTPGEESDAGLLQIAQTWSDDMADLRQQLNDYLGAGEAANVEIVVTENNSVYASPGKQTTSLVNGLYLTDSVGNALQTELNTLVWWDVRNGQEPGNNNSSSLYGWRQYGDYGILSTPSTGGSTGYYDPYPTYYALKLLQHFARGGDIVVEATSDDPLLSVFATKRGDGSLSLLIINKSPTDTKSATINLTGFSPAATATTYSYGIAQDEAARTGTGSPDLAVGMLGISSPSFTASFEPYSMTVVSIPTAIAATNNARLISLSARANVGTGENVLIAGFALGGTDNKEILFRGVGPRLANLGVVGVLANPFLDLVDAKQNVLDSNDNWEGSQAFVDIFKQVGAFSFPDASSLDSALLYDSKPGSYTSLVSGVGLTSGVALAEIYDAEPTANSRLLSLSARAVVGTGENVLIAGLTIKGTTPKRILIRGIGPTLAKHGVNGVLADPVLRLFDAASNVITENDDWGGTPEFSATFAEVFAFTLPQNSLDAAILITLPPGLYSAHVLGSGQITGVALVEVYEVP